MPSEIGALPPSPAPIARTPSTATELAVRLLEPLAGLLEEGQSAKAEVLSLRSEHNSFAVLLKLTLSNNQQVTVPATSNKALVAGSQMDVLALPGGKLAISNAFAPASSTTTPLNTLNFPPGSMVEGKVQSCTPLPIPAGGQALFRLIASLAGQGEAQALFEIDSPQPLAIGSLFSAKIVNARLLQLLSPDQQLAQRILEQQLAQQQSRQLPLTALLGALSNLSDQEPLPEGLKLNIQQLLASLPKLEALSDPEALRKALHSSGSFFETRLLGGLASTAASDFKGQLLRLIQQLMPLLPGSNPLGAATSANLANQLSPALPALLRELLSQQAGTRNPTIGFPLPQKLSLSEGENDLELLLKLAAAAISRVQSHQLGSLMETRSLPDGTEQRTWQLELPLQQQHGFSSLQLKIQNDQPAPGANEEQRRSIWRIDLAFDLAELGPIQIQAQLCAGQFSSQIWAVRSSTLTLAQQELPWLRERLNAAGFNVGELNCQQGQAPQGPRTQVQQRWIDEQA